MCVCVRGDRGLGMDSGKVNIIFSLLILLDSLASPFGAEVFFFFREPTRALARRTSVRPSVMQTSSSSSSPKSFESVCTKINEKTGSQTQFF